MEFLGFVQFQDWLFSLTPYPSLILLLVSLVYCFSKKNTITIDIYRYILFLMLFNLFVWICIDASFYLIEKYYPKILLTKYTWPTILLSHFIIAIFGTIHILKKFFSCKSTWAYMIFCLFTISLMGIFYFILVIIVIFIWSGNRPL